MRMTKRRERQLDTRRRLVEAARSVFARRGFHGASLAAIAAEAGVTTGAVYSNFAGKEDLFLALLDDTTARHVANYRRTTAKADLFMRFLERDPGAWILFMEFWVYAVRDDELRARLARGHAALRIAIAEMLLESDDPALTPDDAHFLATIVQAIGSGLALIKLLDRDDVPPGTFERALELVYRGAESGG